MIYLTLTFWLFMILFAGIGVYKMLGRFGRPRWVDWAILPGTIVSEMAYIFGCLITGAEVRRAKLISSADKSGGKAAPATEATPRLKIVGPIIAALIAIVSCMAAIVIVHSILGRTILDEFHDGLSKTLPTSPTAFWSALRGQIDLLRSITTTWRWSDWSNWRVPVFVYFSLCLSIRLAPVSRPVRPTLAAAVVISGIIALAGTISPKFENLISNIWPLLTYVWTSLLLLLLVTLLFRGIFQLFQILTGRIK